MDQMAGNDTCNHQMQLRPTMLWYNTSHEKWTGRSPDLHDGSNGKVWSDKNRYDPAAGDKQVPAGSKKEGSQSH